LPEPLSKAKAKAKAKAFKAFFDNVGAWTVPVA